MDENKLEKLKEVKYIIHNTCTLCQHSSFFSGFTDWGVCKLHKYNHKKHTESEREMSINRSGSCKDFLIKEDNDLAHFVNFKVD